MGSPLIKRLDALYQRAQMVMAVQADHAPFVSIAPWSFMKDECIVKYYPEGNYQKPERITTTLHVYKSYMIFNAEFEFLLVAPLLFFKAIFSTEKINRFKMLLPLIFKS